MPKKRFYSGVIDPVTIIGVLFLIITAGVGTYVVRNRNINLDINERASCSNTCLQSDFPELCGCTSDNIDDAPAGSGGISVQDEIDEYEEEQQQQNNTPVIQPTTPPTTGCNANGTIYQNGSVVVGGTSSSGYSRCEGNAWTACPTCTITQLTTVPAYLQEQYNQAVEEAQQILQNQQLIEDAAPKPNDPDIQLSDNQQEQKDICLLDGGIWNSQSTSCNYTTPQQLKEQVQTIQNIRPRGETRCSGSMLETWNGSRWDQEYCSAGCSQNRCNPVMVQNNTINFGESGTVSINTKNPCPDGSTWINNRCQLQPTTNVPTATSLVNNLLSYLSQGFNNSNQPTLSENFNPQMSAISVTGGQSAQLPTSICEKLTGQDYQNCVNDVWLGTKTANDIAIVTGSIVYGGGLAYQYAPEAINAVMHIKYVPQILTAADALDSTATGIACNMGNQEACSYFQASLFLPGFTSPNMFIDTFDDLTNAWSGTGARILDNIANSFDLANALSDSGTQFTDNVIGTLDNIASIDQTQIQQVNEITTSIIPSQGANPQISDTIAYLDNDILDPLTGQPNSWYESQIGRPNLDTTIITDPNLVVNSNSINGWRSRMPPLDTFPDRPNEYDWLPDQVVVPINQNNTVGPNFWNQNVYDPSNGTLFPSLTTNPTVNGPVGPTVLEVTNPSLELVEINIPAPIANIIDRYIYSQTGGFLPFINNFLVPNRVLNLASEPPPSPLQRVANWIEDLTNPSLTQKYELAVRDRLSFNNGDYAHTRTDLENIKERFLEYNLSESVMNEIDQKVLGRGPIVGFFDQLSFDVRTILFDARNQANPSINNIEGNIQTGLSIYDVDKDGLPKATEINTSWLNISNDFWSNNIVSPDGKLLPRLRTDPSNLKLEQQYKIALDSIEGIRSNKHSLSEVNAVDSAYKNAGLSEDAIHSIRQEINSQAWGDVLPTKETWLSLFYGYDFSEPILPGGGYTKNMNFLNIADDFITSPSIIRLTEFTNASSPVLVLIGTTYSGYEFWNNYISDETKQSVSNFWNSITLPIFNLFDKKESDKGINIIGKKVRDILPPPTTNLDSASTASEELDGQNENSLINDPTISTTGSNLNLDSTPDQYKLAVFLTNAVNDFYSLQQTAGGRNQIIQTIQKSGLANLYPYINLSVYGGSGNVTTDNKNTYALYIMAIAKLNNVILNTKVTDFVGPDNVFSSWYGFKVKDKFQVAQCVMWQNLLAITYPELNIAYGYDIDNANDVRGHINYNNYSIIDGGKHFSSNLDGVQFFEFTDINNVQKGDTCVYGSGVGHMCTILDKYEHNGKLYFLISEANSPNGKLDGTPQTYLVDEAGFMNLVGLEGVLFLRSNTSYLNDSLKNPSKMPDSFVLPNQNQSSIITPYQQNDPPKDYSNQLLAYADVGLGGKELPKTYVPSELINIELDNVVEHGDVVLTKNAAEALAEFAEYAKSQGYTLYIYSGYRSYEEQAQLHNENPDRSASAGNSQHQTGLAIDIYHINSAGEIKALPGRIIQKAPEFGLIHPVHDDPPHFLFIDDLGIDTSDFNVIAKSENDYLLLNEAIQEAQSQTGSSRQ